METNLNATTSTPNKYLIKDKANVGTEIDNSDHSNNPIKGNTNLKVVAPRKGELEEVVVKDEFTLDEDFDILDNEEVEQKAYNLNESGEIYRDYNTGFRSMANNNLQND
jgi:hypothetical protein